MSVLICLAGKEYECCHNNGNAGGPPKNPLGMCWKAEIPRNEVDTAVRQDNAEEEYTISTYSYHLCLGQQVPILLMLR